MLLLSIMFALLLLGSVSGTCPAPDDCAPAGTANVFCQTLNVLGDSITVDETAGEVQFGTGSGVPLTIGPSNANMTVGAVEFENGLFMGVCRLRDEKEADVHGGTSVAASWNPRELNVIETYGRIHCALEGDSGNFTLGVGVYRIFVFASAYEGTGLTKVRLKSTDGTSLLLGHNAQNSVGSMVDAQVTIGGGILNLASDTTMFVDHYTELSNTNNLGLANSDSTINYYTDVFVYALFVPTTTGAPTTSPSRAPSRTPSMTPTWTPTTPD